MISKQPLQVNGEASPVRLELELRNRELSILNTFARVLNTSIDLEDALQVALEDVGDLLGLDTRLKPLVATRLVENTGSTANSEIGLTQSLTTRELEVLTLIARGYSN